MVSNIDETRPITGIDQPVQVIRDNFTIAKIEITELQARKFDIDGTTALTGPLELVSFTLAGLPPAIDNKGSLVYVSDGAPASPFFSDGLTWSAIGAGGGLFNVVEDITPQLGGQLDVNTFGLGDGTNLLLGFVEDASAVNHIEIENEATGAGPIIRAAGADTNVDLLLAPKGTGEVQVGIDTANAVITSADAPVSSGNPGRSLTISSGSGDGAGDGGNILITPGTAPGAGIDGSIILAGLVWPIVDGTSGQALTSDGAGNLSFTTIPGTGLFNVVEDTTPQLGGQLDVNTFGLGDGTNLLLDFVEDASAVNHIQIENEATGGGPIIRAVGTDTNIDLKLSSKGTGDVAITGDVTVSGTTTSTGQIVYPNHVVASLPTGITGGMIFVTDETGGAIPAFYDGTNWRRVTDRAIVA